MSFTVALLVELLTVATRRAPAFADNPKVRSDGKSAAKNIRACVNVQYVVFANCRDSVQDGPAGSVGRL